MAFLFFRPEPTPIEVEIPQEETQPEPVVPEVETNIPTEEIPLPESPKPKGMYFLMFVKSKTKIKILNIEFLDSLNNVSKNFRLFDKKYTFLYSFHIHARITHLKRV